jgi:selenocysteine lyase/cysteine desulfurase
MLNPESRIRDFPSMAERIYLNTAAEGIPPRAVLDALKQYGEDKLIGMDGRLLHQEQWSQARSKIGQFMGLQSENIGICSCSSEAYNLAYLALRLKTGDEVIINDLDFPAGATPWMSNSSQATVKVWRSRDGILDVADLAKLLTPKTRLVNTSLVSFYNGFRIDINEVSEVIRKNSNAMLAVDVTQALARIPLDVKKADLIIS